MMSGDEMRREIDSKPGMFYGYTVVAVASFSMALIFSVHYAFGVFFKPLANDFGWTRAMTSGAFSLVWIVQGLLSIVMGGLNDKFGPRAVLTGCGVLIGSGYLLMSQITSIWQLYLFYGVIVGAGLGGVFVPLTSTTARWFLARRGLMTGIVAAGVGIGAFVGPPIASRLITVYDWRHSYMILGTIILVGVVVSAQFLRRDPAQMGMRPYGQTERLGDLKVQFGGLSMKDALYSKEFWIVSIVFFCYGFTLSAILLHLGPHATDVGISPGNAANILASLGAGSILGKILLGGFADKIGDKKIYIISFLLMSISSFALIPVVHLPVFYLLATLFGFAYGGLATAHSPLVAWLFGMKQHGLIFGLCFNGWTLGCALGPIIAGYIYDRTHNYLVAFVVCGSIAAVGLILTILLSPASPMTQLGMDRPANRTSEGSYNTIEDHLPAES
jgi:MFS family permease